MTEVPTIAKTAFYDRLAKVLLPEMRLLFKGGKLWSKDSWRNVAEHCLVEAAAVSVLTQALGFAKEEVDQAVSVAAVHDWKKRMEIRPSDFTEEDRKDASDILDRLQPDAVVLSATETSFNDRFRDHYTDISLPEKVMFYIDNICAGTQIVEYQARIDEVAARRQDLGDAFWQQQREMGRIIEKELFDILRTRGVVLQDPAEIPSFIRNELQHRMA